jgi:predicted DNA-binding protein (UPF0251 family)
LIQKQFILNQGLIPLSMLDEVELSLDEIEALRLCDLEGLNQIEAAKRMKISQATLCRILTSARKKVAKALIKGKGIKFQKVKKNLVENFLFSRCFGL